MVMGVDFYEIDFEVVVLLVEGKVFLGVGENMKLRNCIVDKNVRIGSNVVIINVDVSRIFFFVYNFVILSLFFFF